MSIQPETVHREIEAERDFWKSRAFQLSEAVTLLSHNVAALADAADEPDTAEAAPEPEGN